MSTNNNTDQVQIKKEGFFQRQKLLSSFLICSVIFFVYFALSGFNIISGNDDYCIFKLIYFGDIGIGCVGYFLSWLLSVTHPLFGNLNTYLIAHEIVSVLSIAVINYVFLSKFKSKAGLLVTISFDIVYFSFVGMDILFSYTSIVACTAGLILMLYGSLYEKRKAFSITQIICGFLLLFWGTQFRYDPVLPMGALAAAMVFGVVLVNIIKLKKDGDFKTAVKKVFKKYIKTGILLLISAILIFSLNTVSSALKHTVDGYDELYEYNIAMSQIIDYQSAPYADNQEFYNKLDINSSADLSMIKSCFIDEDFFTAEKLQAINDYSDATVDGGVYNKGVLSYVLNPVKHAFSNSMESGLLLIFALVLVVFIFTFVFLFILLPKQKSALIRLGILTLGWLFYIWVAGGFVMNNILILPLIIVSIYITLRFNNYQFAVMFIILAGTAALYFYVMTLRLLFHTAMAVIFPAFALIVFSPDRENLLKQSAESKKAKALPVILSVLLVISSLSAGGIILTDRLSMVNTESNTKLEQYIDQHPENVFAINQMCLFRDYFDPFILPEEQKNAANYGLWVSKSGYMKDTLKRNGIKNIFRDSINSNVRIVLGESKNNGISITPHILELETYYNEHYASKGKKIALEKSDEVDHYGIYKVVEKTE